LAFRDSEESAPAEYPPEQPDADKLDDDGTAYGAEEAEMQAALEKELEETEAKITNPPQPVADGDKEMIDGDEAKEDEEGSEAGSEDLEQESSDEDDDEDEEEEGAEGEDTEMGDGDDKPTASTGTVEAQATNGDHRVDGSKPEVMVH
jgi:histone chaperone ASF1